MASTSPYHLLLEKLEAFRRRYYLDQLIRGALLATGSLLAAYLLLSLLEYRFYFPPLVRSILLYGTLGAAAVALGALVLRPLLRYLKLGPRMSDEQAAALIGAHFPEVQDRLLNILQLKRQSDGSAGALIEASIDQKINSMRTVSFGQAVDLKANRRYLPYALPPLLVLLFVLVAAPSVLQESTARLLRPGQTFEREAPFAFALLNPVLEAEQYSDFTLELETEGRAVPESAFVVLADGSRFRMRPEGTGRFAHTFHQVAEDQEFRFEAAGFRSEAHALRVLPVPSLTDLELRLDYPGYTGRPDEVLRQTGDATVPQGTRVTWILRTENGESVGLAFGDSLVPALRRGSGEFHLSRTLYEDLAYKVGVANARVRSRDSLAYRIGVVPDRHPRIRVEQVVDSTNQKFLFFLGEASDDYGLRNLNFHWTWSRPYASGEYQTLEQDIEPIGLDRSRALAAFNHSWNLAEKALQPGDRVTYHFQVWDNDAINGTKSARTPSMSFELPGRDVFEREEAERNADIKDKLAETLEEIDEVQEEIDRLRDKLVQQKDLDWQDRQSLQQLMQQQQEVAQQVEEIREEFQENLSQQSDYKQYDEELVRKQQQLQQMFEEVVPDELKQMMDELEQLLEQLSKEQGLEELEEMALNEEQLENELDRMLELFKQLELEQTMQDAIDQLEELAEEQQALAEESLQEEGAEEDASGEDESGQQEDGDTEEGQQEDGSKQDDAQKDDSALSEKQERINERFEQIQEEMERMEQLNEELSEPNALPDTEEQQEQLEQGLEESLEQLQQSEQSQQQGKQKQGQKQQQQAGEQQQQNAEQMQEMADALSSSLSGMQQEQQSEDLQALRQLLDNLIKLSFDQEGLMDELAAVPTGNPRYVELVQEQFRLREDAEMVEDSLLALANRVFEISTFVTRELADMNRHMDESIEQLAERRVAKGRSEQQYVMTSLNNLALMLDEVMDQMMQQMANQMPGNQMCQKPGQGKPGQQQSPKMGDLQQQLNQQLQQLKDGQKPGQRNPLGAKQFAQMAAKQAAIRQALEQMAQQMQGTGEVGEEGDMAKELREIADEMERTEEELVNKVFENSTLMRQQQILTRLLEAEKAMREREWDNKRESRTADSVTPDLPPSLEEYLKRRQSELDLFKTVPADLKPYYRELVEQYLNRLPD
jgi:hypothetical protein